MISEILFCFHRIFHGNSMEQHSSSFGLGIINLLLTKYLLNWRNLIMENTLYPWVTGSNMSLGRFHRSKNTFNRKLNYNFHSPHYLAEVLMYLCLSIILGPRHITGIVVFVWVFINQVITELSLKFPCITLFYFLVRSCLDESHLVQRKVRQLS